MPEENQALLPCPGGINRLGENVVVTLERWSRDFTMVGDGRFAVVSPRTNAILSIVDLPGVSACGRLAVSPDGRRAAMACSGRYDFNSKRFDTAHSDVVLLDATTTPPAPLQRFAAAARLDAGIQPMLAFASDAMLMGVALDNATGQDRAFTLDVESGELGALLAKNASFVLGGLRYAPGCNDICLLCDADTRVLHRWQFTGPRTFMPLDDAAVESVIGLPSRTMGGL